MNSQVHGAVGAALLDIAHQEASTMSHININECPCGELIHHERGRDDRQTSEKRHLAETVTTHYYIRWTGDMATYRDHLARMIRESKSVGEEEIDRSLAAFLGDLE